VSVGQTKKQTRKQQQTEASETRQLMHQYNYVDDVIILYCPRRRNRQLIIINRRRYSRRQRH
jgi:hypothetical protein